MKYLVKNNKNLFFKLDKEKDNNLKRGKINTNIVYRKNSSFGDTVYQSKINKIYINKNKPNEYFSKKRTLKPVIIVVGNIAYSVENGYFVELLLSGLGFKVVRYKNKKLKINRLLFELHFSHKLYYDIPTNVNIKCIKKRMVIFGNDKIKLIDIVEKIKALRFPNVYKGKGIKYADEVLKLKLGKQR